MAVPPSKLSVPPAVFYTHFLILLSTTAATTATNTNLLLSYTHLPFTTYYFLLRLFSSLLPHTHILLSLSLSSSHSSSSHISLSFPLFLCFLLFTVSLVGSPRSSTPYSLSLSFCCFLHPSQLAFTTSTPTQRQFLIGLQRPSRANIPSLSANSLPLLTAIRKPTSAVYDRDSRTRNINTSKTKPNSFKVSRRISRVLEHGFVWSFVFERADISLLRCAARDKLSWT